KADVVLLDLNMPEMSGMDILTIIKKEQPVLPVIVITGQSDIGTAVEIMKGGAYDYLAKPNDIGRVAVSVQNALKIGELQNSLHLLKKEFFKEDLESSESFSDIITSNPAMYKIFHYMEAIRYSKQPVLLTGETGVGKELFARALHHLSRCSGDFVPLDVSCYDSTMLTDVLFGHVKGAYTGADIQRGGLVKAAKGGTLFLDEIGDLSLEAQTVLLRFIQEREFRQGGDDKLQYTDAKIILATNRNLMKSVEEGTFRKDLYYRLETHNIQIPPLRKRHGDIPLLTEYFVQRNCVDLNRDLVEIPDEFIEMLCSYNFPGNIRELMNLVFNAVTMASDNRLTTESISGRIKIMNREETGRAANFQLFSGSTIPTLKEAEQLLIDEALKRSENHQGKAAALLGISRQALNKRIKVKEME
ncbi:MAG: sigma-54-dependent Fis family transcriptional regulator, partial [Spirochaetaceae bacterium]|nr:sigma-54-dependent Fis family transcriptional regulator [Spirochaetaceae bacterium]